MSCLPHRGVVESPRRRGAGAARARRFARDTRGSGGIEFAFGSVVVLVVAVASFAVYTRIEAATSAPRIAILMAEYISQEGEPDGDQLDALARFLRDHELKPGYDLLIVTTAAHKPASKAAGVLWIDRIALGDKTATKDLEKTCKGKGPAGGKAALGDHFTLDDGETVFAVEVCVRAPAATLRASWTGDLYRQYLLPTRHPDVIPAAPKRTPASDDGST